MLCWQLFLYSVCFLVFTKVAHIGSTKNQRHKRFLIFPRQAPTRHQFIAGIGIPADLSLESLTIGYVLKAEYFLPYNATVFRENPFFPEYTGNVKNTYLEQRKMPKEEKRRSNLRWAIYKFIADRLDSHGYNGQECILKAICEAKALSFERHYSVFAELMHLLLSPRESKDQKSDLTVDYFEAEKLGINGEKSCELYNCELSILNFISKAFRVL